MEVTMWFYKRTNFKAGDLRIEVPNVSKFSAADPNFVAPRKIDNRDMLLVSSNQGMTPHCAGYATAGYIEFINWKVKHYPEQVDGDAIYERAKLLDHDSADGTTLEFAAEAALCLGLISHNEDHFVAPTKKDLQFALHQFGVVVCGFDITDDWNYVNSKGDIAFTDRPDRLGGHAVLACGYDDIGVYIQNSWGKTWGIHGFGRLSWEQVSDQFMYGLVIQ